MTVIPVAALAIDAQADTAFPTRALLARDLVRRKTEVPRHAYRTWDLHWEEPLARVPELHGIPFPIFLYNIAPFWLPNLAQQENTWDEQQTKLHQEAMEELQ